MFFLSSFVHCSLGLPSATKVLDTSALIQALALVLALAGRAERTLERQLLDIVRGAPTNKSHKEAAPEAKTRPRNHLRTILSLSLSLSHQRLNVKHKSFWKQRTMLSLSHFSKNLLSLSLFTFQMPNIWPRYLHSTTLLIVRISRYDVMRLYF